MRPASRRAAILGFSAVLLLWIWQYLTVRYNYQGNWTGLFCIRDTMPVPAFLRAERPYVFRGIDGYDGQVFHLIAHDPWMRKGSREAIARPAFRYQRILVPALAWTIALGDDRRVDAAYIACILGFIFLGVYWTSLAAMAAGLAPAWGLLFAIAPATIVSIDRMTVDVALAALAAGFAVYCQKGFSWRVAAILVCAALTRETALPIIGAYAIYLLTRKRVAAAVLAASTALPAAAWFVYLRSQTSEHSLLATFVDWIPLYGLVDRVIHPHVYSLTPLKDLAGRGLDLVALAGVALALVFTARAALRKEWNPRAAATYALAIAVVFLGNRSVWEDVYAFGRVLTPFLLLAAIGAWPRRAWIAALPILSIDARIGLNLAAQAAGVIRGVAGIHSW